MVVQIQFWSKTSTLNSSGSTSVFVAKNQDYIQPKRKTHVKSHAFDLKLSMEMGISDLNYMHYSRQKYNSNEIYVLCKNKIRRMVNLKHKNYTNGNNIPLR